MMRDLIVCFFMVLLLLTGCDNKEENLKNEYVDIKSKLLNNHQYTDGDNLPCDIVYHVDRVSEENVKFNIVLNHPKENMKDIKAMVIHNCYEEELFPTIGIFDKSQELLMNNDEELVMSGNIKTVKNVSQLDLKFSVWFEYKNDSGEVKEIFYKTT